MFDGGGFYPPQLDGFDALGAGEAYRREPEFAFAFSGIDVDVRRFGTLVGVEMEAPAEQPEDGGHYCFSSAL